MISTHPSAFRDHSRPPSETEGCSNHRTARSRHRVEPDIGGERTHNRHIPEEAGDRIGEDEDRGYARRIAGLGPSEKEQNGGRKMPPPVPVSPDRKPMAMPHKTPAHIGGSVGWVFDFSPLGASSRAPLINNTAPTKGL